MTKIADNAARAFVNDSKFNAGGNTKVSNGEYVLYYSTIAKKMENQIYVNFHNYVTQTTKARINAICDVLGVPRFSVKKGDLYFGNQEVSPNQDICLM